MEDYPWFCVSTPRDAEHAAVLKLLNSQLLEKGAAELKHAGQAPKNRYVMRMIVQKNFKVWLPSSCFISLECSAQAIEYGVPPDIRSVQGLIPDKTQMYRPFDGFTDVFGNDYKEVLSTPRKIDYVFWDIEQKMAELVVANLYVRGGRGQRVKSAEISYTKSKMSLDALPNEIFSYMEEAWKTRYNSILAS